MSKLKIDPSKLPENFTRELEGGGPLNSVWTGRNIEGIKPSEADLKLVSSLPTQLTSGELKRVLKQFPYGAFAQNSAEAFREISGSSNTSEYIKWLIKKSRYQIRKLYSTATDLDSAVSSVKFVAHPWIARGVVTLFISAPGLGKTQIAVDISKRFLNPELKWFDDQVLEDVPTDSVIVWCDTESFQGALKDLFDRLGMDKDRVILPFPDPLKEVQLDRHIGHLDEVLLEVEASLLIVDSLRGSHKNDENDSNMQNLLSGLSKIVQSHNICCIVIHHTNKPVPGMPDIITSIHRVRGSSAIAAQCRIVWALDDPNPSSGYLRLQVIKNNLAKQADPLGVKITDEGVVWDLKSPEQPKSGKKKTQEEKAHDFLVNELWNGPRPAKEVEEKAKEEGITPMTLRRAAGNWVAKNKERVEDGPWMWSLEGISLGDMVAE